MAKSNKTFYAVPGPRSDPDPQHRKVKQYNVTDTELFSMSLLSTLGSFVLAIGWKFGEIAVSLDDSAKKYRWTFIIASFVMLTAGFILVFGYWNIVRFVLRQSGQTLGSLFAQKIAADGKGADNDQGNSNPESSHKAAPRVSPVSTVTPDTAGGSAASA